MNLSFLAPWWLWLLVGVAALLVGYVIVQRQRRQYAVRFTNVDLLASIAPKHPGWRRHLAAGLLLATLAFMVMALAKPARAVKVPRETASVVLAIDVSLSMQATDVAPDRIRAAQRAVGAFVDTLPDRFQLGLVAFAGDAQVLVPPTTRRNLVRRAVQDLRLQQMTAIGEAIFAGLRTLDSVPGVQRGEVPGRIVLLSDGATTTGRSNEQAIAAARQRDVPVSTIAFGTDEGTVTLQGEVTPVPADREALRLIADRTRGTFATAATEGELRKTYADLGSKLAYSTRSRPITGWFIGIAILLGFTAAGASLVWTSRLP